MTIFFVITAVISLPFILNSALFLFNRYSSISTKELEDYLKENFELSSLKSSTRFGPPILSQSDFFVKYEDINNNDCFMIISKELKKYIIVYNNLVIDDNSDDLVEKSQGLLKKITGTSDLIAIDIKVKKCSSNVELFNDDKIGEMRLTVKLDEPVEGLPSDLLEEAKSLIATEDYMLVYFNIDTSEYIMVPFGRN